MGGGGGWACLGKALHELTHSASLPHTRVLKQRRRPGGKQTTSLGSGRLGSSIQLEVGKHINSH